VSVVKPTTCILVAAVAIYAAFEIYWKNADPRVDLSLAAGSSTTSAQPIDPVTLDRAARAFRMQLYETFRDRPDEIERRQTAYRAVLAAWQAAGSQPEDAIRVVSWLEAAIEASLSSGPAALPETPVFKKGDILLFQKPATHSGRNSSRASV
jgi:hypothetical protein